MPGDNLVSLALRDVVDDVVYHGTNVAQGAFDLVCMTALSACFYAASLDGTTLPLLQPGMTQVSAIPESLLPADAPALCLALSDLALGADGGCISAMVLADQVGT
jgi:hypothetical protein